MLNNVTLSIIIPTRNSEDHLERLLKSIFLQKNNKVEVIVVDNKSIDETEKIAKKYSAKFIVCNGPPPQVALQRNIGAKAARGSYVYFMDHDMELSGGFIKSFFKQILIRNEIDAWHIPEKIIAKGKYMRIIRNFESDFINGTPVSAVRLIKRRSFLLTDGYDNELSGGPSDWDLNNQLIVQEMKFGIFPSEIFHHEENLSMLQYIKKKTNYTMGGEKYKYKWKRKNKKIFNTIVKKQYSVSYRLFILFVQNGNWKRVVKELDKYLLFVIVKFILAAYYYLNLRLYKYEK